MVQNASAKKSRIHQTRDEIIFQIISSFFLIILSALIVLPFLNVLALSFNDGKDAMLGGITFWPRKFTLENYQYVFSTGKYLSAYGITISRTLLGSALGVICTAMAGYALKSRTLPGRKAINKFFVLTMFFSGGTIPVYLALKSYGLLNTFWVFIINGSLVSAWDIMVMRTFFEGLGEDLEEAARLDGAGTARIFVSIILPLSKAVIAVIFLFKAVYHWNDWFSGAYYVTDSKLYPMQTIVQRMLQQEEALKTINEKNVASDVLNSGVTGESLKMAIILFTITPILCVYPFVQKYFVKGVMIGAVKG